VNRENLFLFTPMLHEVASCELNVTPIVNPNRKLLRIVRFFKGDVRGIDLEKREVVGSHRSGGLSRTLGYDHVAPVLSALTTSTGFRT
jgi:NADH:ubiquinone reductase (H+-translocating)